MSLSRSYNTKPRGSYKSPSFAYSHHFTPEKKQPIQSNLEVVTQSTEGQYHERQVGGYCRKHAINAFYGEEKITIQQFVDLCHEFPGDDVPAEKFDAFGDCRNVVGYTLLKLTNDYTYYVPIGKRTDDSNYLIELAEHSGACFVFNENHIWCLKNRARSAEEDWYNIDSLKGGPQKCVLASFVNNQKVGLLISISQADRIIEINRYMEIIHNITIAENLMELAVLTQRFEDGIMVGNVEKWVYNLLWATNGLEDYMELNVRLLEFYMQFINDPRSNESIQLFHRMISWIHLSRR